MHKRYRVFIGSAFDLGKERSLVIQTLIEMYCIPEGMQLFPLREEKEFEHIKNIIDSSDCYLMVLGDRLGTGHEEKMIYIKKEYEYALHKGLDVLVLMHHDLDTVFRSESSPVIRDLYSSIHADSALEYWNDSDDLQKNLLAGFSKTIRTKSLSSPASRPKTECNEEPFLKSLADENVIAAELIALAQSSFSRAAEQAIRENDAYGITTHGAVKGKLEVRQPGN